MNVRVNATHVVEGRTFVTDGSRHCPSRWQCEPRGDESYADFVRRHLTEHEIFIGFESFEDAQRNLFVWCFYSCLKFLLENDAITPQHMWESCEFLANWDFHEDDLEMNTPKAERRYMLPPLAHRRPGVVKRQKKHEAPRETLKTTDAFGLCTFEHLHERFVRDNVNFRINVYSSTTKLGKKRYVAAAAKAWGKKTGRLFELFGGTEIYGPEGKKQTRRISLLHTRGAIDRVTGVVQLRWLQDADKSFATHSLMALGEDSESTGERSDLAVCDDVCTKDNSDKIEKRIRVKGKSAEWEKQLEHGGRWLWIDTRKHLDDASGEIDREPTRGYYHILHRRACWICPDCGEVVYYFPKDGTGKPRVDEAYLAEQKSKHSERDFWNELMNEPQDPEKQTFKREWFRIVKRANAPLEIRAGLGLLNSEEDRLLYEQQIALLTENGIRIFAINCGDPAGRELASKRGDRTAIPCFRLDASSGIWITLLRSGHWSAQQQKEEAYHATLYNKPFVFIWEIVQDSGVEKAWSDFAREKSAATGQPVLMPMRFVKPKRVLTKQQRIEELEPYFRRGVNILEDAGTPAEIELFISQFLEFLIGDHDDYPDAAAQMIDYLKTIPLPKEAPKTEEPFVTINDAGNPMVALGSMFDKMRQPRGQTWGTSGGVR
jgi:hypothetical protein